MMDLNETPDAIGRYLMLLRQERKLRIGEIASSTGLSANTIRWIERGVTQPKPESLKLLAAALQVEYQDLLVRAGYLERPQMDETERELLQRFNALSAKAKSAVLQLLPLLEQADSPSGTAADVGSVPSDSTERAPDAVSSLDMERSLALQLGSGSGELSSLSPWGAGDPMDIESMLAQQLGAQPGDEELT